MEKKLVGTLVILFIVSLLTVDVKGIPNSFGGTSFINPAGMRLEDFAAQKGIWEQNAELKGTWEFWKADEVTDPAIELLHLNMPAIVFGIPASEVTVQRKDNTILQFQVVFEPYDQIKDIDKLNRVVRANASLWSGSSASSDIMKFGAAVYYFKYEPENKRVVVTIKP